jgi:hypothetical protein
MKYIKLTKGQRAKVDDKDYDYLMQWKWLCNNGYAARGVHIGYYPNKKPRCKLLYMHREIIQVPSELDVDHVDRDRLNNQRINLRACTSSQNCCNQKKHFDAKSSKYKGVHWNKHHKRWRVKLVVSGKRFDIGAYKTEEEAALAYNKAAIKHHKVFAVLNKIGV